jgi:glyoxylase-like metal-dependent hydrolase (beta-lactamase superfamily II)
MTTLRKFRPGLLLTEVHLNDFDMRGAVIIGSKRAAIWDSLSHPRDMLPLRDILPEEWSLIYSHADWDHVWGTAGLPYQDKAIIGHANCLARFSEDVPLELQEKKTAQPGHWDEVVLIPPTVTFDHDLSLDLGGLTLSLHHLPGHTEDCIVGFIQEQGILLAGDTVETPFPVVNFEDLIDEWISGLRNWESDARVQHVIPSHGVIGGRELIRQNIIYLENLKNSSPSALPADLDDFYRKTHEENLRHLRKFFI